MEDYKQLNGHPADVVEEASSSQKKVPSYKIFLFVACGAFSGYNFYHPSYIAAARVTKHLAYVAAICGVGTNAFFSIESYFSLSIPLEEVKKKWGQYFFATFFAVCTALPEFFLNIVDDDNNYLPDSGIALYVFVLLLTVPVYIDGTLEMVRYCNSCSRSNEAKQITAVVNKIPSDKKLLYRLSLIVILVVFSLPFLAALSLATFFGIKDILENKAGANLSLSIALGSVAVAGFMAPMLGFTLKGAKKTAEMIALRHPITYFSIPFMVLGLFSGFTTFCSGQSYFPRISFLEDASTLSEFSIINALSWLANIGCAIFFNIPQMILFAERASAALKEHWDACQKTDDHNYYSNIPMVDSEYGQDDHNYYSNIPMVDSEYSQDDHSYYSNIPMVDSEYRQQEGFDGNGENDSRSVYSLLSISQLP